GEEGHQRDDLEEGQSRVAERPGDAAADLLQKLAGAVLGDRAAADADPLAEVVQVRARVESGPQAGGAQPRFGEGAGRTLSVGPGDVEHRRAPLRIAEPRARLAHALETQL